jgi:hypothetical protein
VIRGLHVHRVKYFAVQGRHVVASMKNLALAVGLSAVVITVSVAGAAPELPVPRHYTLQDYQNVRSEGNGFDTFSMQTSWVKALISESTGKYVNITDPDTGTTQSNSYALGQQLGMLLSGKSPRSVCERNAQFFQTMPRAPTVTRCQRIGTYGYPQVPCTTN